MLTKQENIKWLKLFRPDLTNKQINEYINYIYKHNRIDKRTRQKHHIIPRNYFKYANNITQEQYVLLMKHNIANLTIKIELTDIFTIYYWGTNDGFGLFWLWCFSFCLFLWILMLLRCLL